MSPKNPKTSKGFIVTIDGPSGAGKSTVSRLLADELGGKLLDTGAMYRGVAFHTLRFTTHRKEKAIQVAKKLKFSIDPKTETLLINGVDLGHKIRTEEVGKGASELSTIREVRQLLTRRQRSLAREWSKRIPVVVEGRDIGSVVFPNVPFKFFVTADPKVRAQRRYLQLKKQGQKGVSLKKILAQNEERDERDQHRRVAPLKVPEGAVIVDTSSMAISQVVKFMHDHLRARLRMHV
jgi:cytidylate kinase